jgi:hypothetical protein
MAPQAQRWRRIVTVDFNKLISDLRARISSGPEHVSAVFRSPYPPARGAVGFPPLWPAAPVASLLLSSVIAKLVLLGLPISGA